MRIEFLEPQPGQATPSLVSAMLALVGSTIDAEQMERWTPIELTVAFDWAARQHLIASDNRVKDRPKPNFVRLAEEVNDVISRRGEATEHAH